MNDATYEKLMDDMCEIALRKPDLTFENILEMLKVLELRSIKKELKKLNK